MFESAEIGHKLDKKTFEREEPVLRAALLDAQFDLAEAKAFSVVILVGGVDGAGKGDTVNTLNAWMDPRQIETNAMGQASDEEEARPPMWRFWRALPPKGKIGVFFGSWYTAPIIDRVARKTDDAAFDRSLDEILRFERMLAAEGTLVLKFWFHLSKEAQRKRLKALEKDKATRWRVTETDWARFRQYSQFRTVSELALRRTNTGHAPWIVVEGSDQRYRAITVGKTLLEALTSRLARAEPPSGLAAPPPPPAVDGLELLHTLDLTKAVPRKVYRDELEVLQGRLNMLSRDKKFAERSLIAAFEGMDAAGKGGAIRRVTGALDARFYRVVRVAAPSDEERARPYLWRFWRHVPANGHVTIFDRSWYGRVLVERVEGFAPESDWMRAYTEIVDFEEELAAYGAIVAKFWLAIDKDEQARRFEEREAEAHKRFKLTAEDWRNRDKWEDYVRAVGDMVDRTSTRSAPWTLVEANDKYHARLKILTTLCERIEAAI